MTLASVVLPRALVGILALFACACVPVVELSLPEGIGPRRVILVVAEPEPGDALRLVPVSAAVELAYVQLAPEPRFRLFALSYACSFSTLALEEGVVISLSEDGNRPLPGPREIYEATVEEGSASPWQLRAMVPDALRRIRLDQPGLAPPYPVCADGSILDLP